MSGTHFTFAGLSARQAAYVSNGHWAWIGCDRSGAGKSILSDLALDTGQGVLSDNPNTPPRG